MFEKININFATISRLFVALTGLIKVGYVVNLFQAMIVYNYNYKNTLFDGSFFIFGSILGSFLYYKKIYRCIFIGIAEFIFLANMIIASYVSNVLSSILYFFAGGIAFFAYPFYIREFFLNEDLPMLYGMLWIAICGGMCFLYFINPYIDDFYYKGYNNQNIQDTILSMNDSTPYYIGASALLNIIIVFIQSQKDTIKFYSQGDMSQNNNFSNLISSMYRPQYCQLIRTHFLLSSNQQNHQLLLPNTAHLNRQSSVTNVQKFYIYSVGLFTGISNIFFDNQYVQFSFLNKADLYIQTQYSYIIYLMILALFGFITLQIKIKKNIAILGFFMHFLSFSLLLMNQEDLFKHFEVDWITLIDFSIVFSLTTPLVFLLPFSLLKEHQTVLYFLFLWLGFAINQFIDQYDLIKENYPQLYLIMITVSSFFAGIALYLTKNI